MSRTQARRWSGRAPDALCIDDGKNDVHCCHKQHESKPDAVQPLANWQACHSKQRDTEEVHHEVVGLRIQPREQRNRACTVLPPYTAGSQVPTLCWDPITVVISIYHKRLQSMTRCASGHSTAMRH